MRYKRVFSECYVRYIQEYERMLHVKNQKPRLFFGELTPEEFYPRLSTLVAIMRKTGLKLVEFPPDLPVNPKALAGILDDINAHVGYAQQAANLYPKNDVVHLGLLKLARSYKGAVRYYRPQLKHGTCGLLDESNLPKEKSVSL